MSCSAKHEMTTAEHEVFQRRQCPRGCVGTDLSLQHRQEVRGSSDFTLPLLARLAPKPPFREGCGNTKESSKEGQENDPGLEKELSALVSRQSSSSAYYKEALKTAAAFRVIASPLAARSKIMLLAINYQELVTLSTWMMNYTHT